MKRHDLKLTKLLRAAAQAPSPPIPERVPFRIEAAVLAALRNRENEAEEGMMFRLLLRAVTAAVAIMLISIALGLPSQSDEESRELMIANATALYE